MGDNFGIQLFEGKKVRFVWNEEQEKYYISVIDVVQILTDSARILSNMSSECVRAIRN